MKKGLFLSIILAVLLLFSTTTSQAILIGFDPVSQVMQVGDPVDVDLFISGLGDGSAPSLGAFDLDISFDPAILSFSGYELGPYLGDIFLGEAWDISWGLIAADTVNISELSFLDANNVSGPSYFGPYLEEIQPGSFTLATLTFDTLALGTSSLEIFKIWALGDALGEPLTADVQSGSISPVPEPATLLLMSIGIVGLGYLKRKKRIRS